MNRGYVRELRRTALSRLAIVLAAALAVGGAVSLLAAPSAGSPPSIATVYYWSGGAYHLIGYVYDSQGRPIPGVTVQFSSPQGLAPGDPSSGTTNASGIVVGSFPSAYDNETYTLTAANAAGSTSVSTELTNYPNAVAPGTVVAGFGDLISLRTGTYRSTGALLAFFAGPNGTAPTGYSVEYYFTAFDLDARGVHPLSAPADNDTELANQSDIDIADFAGYAVVSGLSLGPAPPELGPDITVQIVNPDGDVVADAGFPPIAFGPQTIPPPATQAAGLALSELGLAGLVAGLLVGLSLYGTERLSGTLEPFLARPVTPEGLLTVRYLGALGTLAVGDAVGLAALDAGLAARFGGGLPTGLLLVALGASLLALAGWLAVPFLLSHLLRTSQRLTTAVIGVLVVFGFLWTPALQALAPWAGAGPGTLAGATLTFDANVVNAALAASTLVPAGLYGTDVATALGVAVVLLLWVLVPLGVAVWRARTAD